jgi:hypothetical protein
VSSLWRKWFPLSRLAATRMMLRVGLAIVVVAALAGSEAFAALITFSTSQSQFDPGTDNQGWWSSGPGEVNFDANANYLTGMLDGNDIRDFFTFDLSSLGALDLITSATLRLRRYDSSPGNEPAETLGFFDVSTSASALNNNNGLNPAIYADLGTGTSYGTFAVHGFAAASDMLTLSLNASAVNDLNAAKGGFFSIGGALISQDGDDWLFGDSGHVEYQQELILNVEQQSPVPEPASVAVWSILVATLSIATAVRRRRSTSSSA